MKKFHYISLRTGELQTDFRSVLKVAISDFKKYHFLNIFWKYIKNGI